MTAYRAVFSARFRELLQYRAAAFAGLVTQIFWGWIRVMVFTGFYQSTRAPQPLSLPHVIGYIWLSQAFLRVQPWEVDRDVQAMVRTGNVAYELLRPVDLYGLWYARAVALRAAPTLLRAVPMLLLATCWSGLPAPASATSALAAAASITAAVLLAAAMTALVTVSLLYTIAGEGVARLLPILAMFGSGLILPLPLFPDWAQGVFAFLPFRGLADVPFRLYLGDLPPSAAPGLLLHQLAWAAVFVVIGRALLARAMRRLVIQGG